MVAYWLVSLRDVANSASLCSGCTAMNAKQHAHTAHTLQLCSELAVVSSKAIKVIKYKPAGHHFYRQTTTLLPFKWIHR